ncbi:hypothetical protein BKP45_02820 [Anaerobacillus alkalidiazotrophicus]|uniref:YhfM-like domain-containing protein n=1 Tax=Anaerobacillus alkalidiazotrophicus TaxID=472963 RepID=A0A1S2MA75_9BACI|nr:hypothetical protein [Anaerobacillus alkalidiazotrophicus]OIJ21672.1 hypothetical protein BKP45_02820 [Anaerobacillus alkalidiazotrophicus]
MKLKFLLILLSMLLLILGGCTNKTDMSNEMNNENEELQESTPKNPPKVSISNGVEEVKGVLGPYSWTYCCSNGKAISIEASADAPPNLVQHEEPFKVTSSMVISIDFEIAPIRYEVRTWDESSGVIGTYTEIDTLNHKGRAVFEIFATWEQGNASYSFLVDIEYESSSETGANSIPNSLELIKIEETDVFIKAIANSKKKPGIVNMTNPQYQFSIGKDSYFLWITNDSGTIINTKDTHTIYSLPISSVKEIYEFVNNKN